MQVLELSFCQNETNWRQFWIFTALLGDGLLQGQRFGLLGNNVQTTDSCADRRGSPGYFSFLMSTLTPLHWPHSNHISLAFLFFLLPQ